MDTLQKLLESVSVMGPGQWENDDGPSEWYAVCTDEGGIIAYFMDSADAFRFRLDYINGLLNPVTVGEGRA
jgi:hypothetical protein